MRRIARFSVGVALLAVLAAGCTGAQNGASATSAKPRSTQHAGSEDADAAEREAAFAQLGSQDRLLAEAQGYCAVTSEPLGSMGPPRKLVVGDQPVFVCCKSCEKKAKSDPDRTLAKVEELKARVQSGRAD